MGRKSIVKSANVVWPPIASMALASGCRGIFNYSRTFSHTMPFRDSGLGTQGNCVPWHLSHRKQQKRVFVLRWEMCTFSLFSQSNKSLGPNPWPFPTNFPIYHFPFCLPSEKQTEKSEKHFPLITSFQKGCGRPLRGNQCNVESCDLSRKKHPSHNNPKKQEDERAFKPAGVHLSSARYPHGY